MIRPEQFGALLREEIEKRGITAFAMMKICGIGESTIYGAINKDKPIFYPVNRRILDALEIDEDIEKAYCIECGMEYYRKGRKNLCCCKECYEKQRMTTFRKERLEEKEKNNTSTLNDILLKAREKGMTYGQYVARYDR